MTTPQEAAALNRIAVSTSKQNLERYMNNTRGRSETVYRAAFERLVHVAVEEVDDPITRACWQMVLTVEQVRRDAGRKVSRMNRLRPKIEREGERAALAYCALNETEGFAEVLAFGLPQYTAEAIVLGYPNAFEEAVLVAARKRLAAADVDPVTYEGNPLV